MKRIIAIFVFLFCLVPTLQAQIDIYPYNSLDVAQAGGTYTIRTYCQNGSISLLSWQDTKTQVNMVESEATYEDDYPDCYTEFGVTFLPNNDRRDQRGVITLSLAVEGRPYQDITLQYKQAAAADVEYSPRHFDIPRSGGAYAITVLDNGMCPWVDSWQETGTQVNRIETFPVDIEDAAEFRITVLPNSSSAKHGIITILEGDTYSDLTISYCQQAATTQMDYFPYYLNVAQAGGTYKVTVTDLTGLPTMVRWYQTWREVSNVVSTPVPTEPSGTGYLTELFITFSPNDFGIKNGEVTFDFGSKGSFSIPYQQGPSTVSTEFSPGSIKPVSQTITSGQTPTILLNDVAACGGTETVTYLWESSTDEAIWTVISGATEPSYQPGVLHISTYYRRKAIAGDQSDYSNTAWVEVVLPQGFYPGSITPACQTIYSGQIPARLVSETEASGAAGSIAYFWSCSTDGIIWGDIPDAIGLASYQPWALTTSMFFRREAVAGTLTDYSNTVWIEVLPAQTFTAGNENWVFTKTSAEGVTRSGVTYYDGLGSPSQAIQIGASPQGNDIVVPFYYDNVRRSESRSYLPYVSQRGSGQPDSLPLVNQTEFYERYYGKPETPYSETIFEASPLNRPVKQYNAGSVFHEDDAYTAYSYEFNNANEVYWLKVDTLNSLRFNNPVYFPKNCLQKNTVIDADGATSIIFTDGHKTILDRKLNVQNNQTEFIDTYYVYDDFGRLCWIVSPMASKSLGYLLSDGYWDTQNEEGFGRLYCYNYKYDGRNRIVEKWLPEKGVEYFVYDKLDRPVLSQDGKLREQNRWVYTVYDDLDRPARQNIVENIAGMTRQQIQDKLNTNMMSECSRYPVITDSKRVLVPFNDASFRHVATLSETMYGGYKYLLYTPSEDTVQYNTPNEITVIYFEEETSMGLCAIMRPIMEQIATENTNPNITFVFYDCEYEREIADYYGAYQVPNIRIYKQGVLKENVLGLASKSEIEYIISNVLLDQSQGLLNPPDSAQVFMIPEYLSYNNRPHTLIDQDRSLLTHGMKIYEKVAILDGESVTNNYVERAFYYDRKARPIQTVEKNHLGGISRYTTKYDPIGNILVAHESQQSSATAASDTKLIEFTYDHYDRLLSETTTLNGGTPAVVHYGYDELGKLVARTYGEGVSAVTDSLKSNIQGWLTELGSDLFKMKLKYYDTDIDSLKSYTGNISEWLWQHQGTPNLVANRYMFGYDLLGRLKSTTHKTGNTMDGVMNTPPAFLFAEKNMTYDQNGNTLTLTRDGRNKNTGQVGGDQLTYAYIGYRQYGNQLVSVLSNDVLGEEINGMEAYYDPNGNPMDYYARNLTFKYNLLNLMSNASFMNSSTKVDYSWLADGSKSQVKDDNGEGYTYLGSLVYRFNATDGARLESTDFGAGRIIAGSSAGDYEPYYHIRDHLGSVRVVFTYENGLPQIKAQNDYYPFGGRHNNPDLAIGDNTVNRYRFNGKESQTVGGIGLLDYGARMYDPVIGRWLGMDPLAEQSPWVSSYAFCMNNPIRLIDPNGMTTYTYDWDAQVYRDENGKEVDWWIVYSWVRGGGKSGVPIQETITIGPNNTDFYDIFGEFILGRWPDRRTFVDGDHITEEVKQHPYLAEVRKLIIERLKQEKNDGEKYYSLNNKTSLYFSDIMTFASGGAKGKNNVSVAALGSCNFSFTILSVDQVTKTAKVQIRVDNPMTASSGIRPPKVGYSSFWQNYISPVIDLVAASHGITPKYQTIKWTETIKF